MGGIVPPRIGELSVSPHEADVNRAVHDGRSDPRQKEPLGSLDAETLMSVAAD